MIKGMGDLMKQFGKMQEKMDEMQKVLENSRLEGSAGGGVIKVVANGKGEILEMKINPEVVNPNEIEMLQDLVMAAVNQARQKAEELMKQNLAKITGGLKIPGLPF